MTNKNVTDFLDYVTEGEHLKTRLTYGHIFTSETGDAPKFHRGHEPLTDAMLTEWAQQWYETRGEKADPDTIQRLVNQAFDLVRRETVYPKKSS